MIREDETDGNCEEDNNSESDCEVNEESKKKVYLWLAKSFCQRRRKDVIKEENEAEEEEEVHSEVKGRETAASLAVGLVCLFV